MNKRISLAIAALTLAGAAWAGQCPMDMKKIDAALAANTELSAEETQKVNELRAEGEAHHAAGRHQESVVALAKAKEILGVE